MITEQTGYIALGVAIFMIAASWIAAHVMKMSEAQLNRLADRALGLALIALSAAFSLLVVRRIVEWL